MSIDSEVSLSAVRCPGCGVDCAYSSSNPYRPFCSARCKNNDFGSWAMERFSVDVDASLPQDENESDNRVDVQEPSKH